MYTSGTARNTKCFDHSQPFSSVSSVHQSMKYTIPSLSVSVKRLSSLCHAMELARAALLDRWLLSQSITDKQSSSLSHCHVSRIDNMLHRKKETGEKTVPIRWQMYHPQLDSGDSFHAISHDPCGLKCSHQA